MNLPESSSFFIDQHVGNYLYFLFPKNTRDMLGSLELTVNGFFNLSRTIVEVAEKICNDRLVLMPESGYNPKVLPPCCYALTAGVIGLEAIGVGDSATPPVSLTGFAEQ